MSFVRVSLKLIFSYFINRKRKIEKPATRPAVRISERIEAISAGIHDVEDEVEEVEKTPVNNK